MNQLTLHKNIVQKNKPDIHNDGSTFLLDLANSLKGLTQLLKQENSWLGALSKKHLYRKNWSLVIGPNNAGKTTLLQTTDPLYSHVHTDHEQTSGIWTFDRSVYIEIPGQFITDKQLLNRWPTIINTIKEIRKRKPLDNVVLTLNLYDFLQQSHQERKTLCQHAIRALKYIAKHTNMPLPLYVTFTHVDCIAGFTEFFSEMTQPQREKILGILIAEHTPNTELSHKFNRGFTQLLQRLNELLLPTLHRTKNAEKRSRIKEFPLQIESMRGLFNYLLQHIIKLNERTLQCQLKGFFFTSSGQQGASFDCLAAPISSHYALELVKHTQQESYQKYYFSQELLHLLIPADKTKTPPEKPSWLSSRNKHLAFYGGIYATIALTALGSIFYLFQHFRQTAGAFQQINSHLLAFNRLQQSVNYSKLDSYQLASSINLLSNLKDDAANINQSWPLSFPYPYIKNLKNQVDQLFTMSVQKQFLPNLAREIEHSLENFETDNPADLYHMLKAYLMLGDPSRMQTAYFINWIEEYWQKNPRLKTITLTRNLTLLQQILEQPLQALSMNLHTLNKARQKLSEFPKARLAYLLLKSEATSSVDTNTNDIPKIYTLEGFQQTYQNNIQKIAEELFTRDWVLGKPQTIATDSVSELTKLVSQIQTLYLDDYVSWWQFSVHNTKISDFKSLADAIQALTDFRRDYFTAQGTTPVWLKTLIANTEPLPAQHPLAKLFNDRVASHFLTLRNLKEQNFAAAQQSLRQLENHLEKIAAANNTDKASFLYSKQRYIQPSENDALDKLFKTAEQFPDPIKNWLTTIGNKSWTLLLKKTGNYINEEWQKTILPSYENHLSERFPLSKEAEQDIDIKQFTQFFSGKGTFTQFFNDFIMPFLDTSQANWTAKQLNTVSLSLSNDVIQTFERANIIRLMFFGKENALAKFKFYIKPLTIHTGINHITLNINNQKIFDYYGSTKASQFIWDMNHPTPNAFLELQDNNNKTWRLSEAGPWGWYKLFNKFATQNTEDTKQYILNFTIDSKEAAKYIFLAENAVNPFIPGVLDNFKLEEKVCG